MKFKYPVFICITITCLIISTLFFDSQNFEFITYIKKVLKNIY